MALQLSGDSPHIESSTLSFAFGDGTAAAPSITFDSDVNTGLFSAATNELGFTTAGAEAMRIDSDGYVGIRTASPSEPLVVARLTDDTYTLPTMPGTATIVASPGLNNTGSGSAVCIMAGTAAKSAVYFGDSNDGDIGHIQYDHVNDSMQFITNNSEAMRISANGDILIGKTTTGGGNTGTENRADGLLLATRDGEHVSQLNRLTDDGSILRFAQDGTIEGSVSVSGTTITYNGGHLARWSRLPDESKPEIYKGTVLTNLDEMVVWEGEDNEQLNKTAISSLVADRNVAGLFVAWDNDDDEYNDFYVAMTGDFIVRIAAGTTVQRGDLLMSAGDGTAMPQGDDLVRSCTVAKVTSTTVSATYPDGSYAVPCVIMAC